VLRENLFHYLDYTSIPHTSVTADCCSEGFIRVRYRWKEGQFEEEENAAPASSTCRKVRHALSLAIIRSRRLSRDSGSAHYLRRIP